LSALPELFFFATALPPSPHISKIPALGPPIRVCPRDRLHTRKGRVSGRREEPACERKDKSAIWHIPPHKLSFFFPFRPRRRVLIQDQTLPFSAPQVRLILRVCVSLSFFLPVVCTSIPSRLDPFPSPPPTAQATKCFPSHPPIRSVFSPTRPLWVPFFLQPRIGTVISGFFFFLVIYAYFAIWLYGLFQILPFG